MERAIGASRVCKQSLNPDPRNQVKTMPYQLTLSSFVRDVLPRTGIGTGLLIASAICLPANAELDLLLEGYGFGSGQKLGYNTANLWDSSDDNVNYYQINATQHQWVDAATQQGGLSTYCIQVYLGVDLGESYQFEVTPISGSPVAPPAPGPMGAVRAEVLEDLYARYSGLDDNDVVATAFQMMVWEITHENFTATDAAGLVDQISLDLGAFRWNGQGTLGEGGQAEVDEIFGTMRSVLGTGGFLDADLVGLTNPTAQDQVLQVPAPAGALLLSGLLAGGRRRRRN